MKKLLMTCLLAVGALCASAQTTQETINLSTQADYDKWSVVGGGTNHWSYSSSMGGAQWQSINPIPAEGAILGYSEGIEMGAGTGEVYIMCRAQKYEQVCFELVFSSDPQFTNIVSTVKGTNNGMAWNARPTTNYETRAFSIPEEGIYYVGIRSINTYTNLYPATFNTAEGYLYIQSVNLTYPTPMADVSIPNPITGLTATADCTATALSAKLSWTWPTQNTNGNIISEMGAYIYRSTSATGIVAEGNKIGTIPFGTQSPATAEYTDESVTSPGTYYYAVVPFTEDGVSEEAPTTAECNLQYTTVGALSVPYSTSFPTPDGLDGYTNKGDKNWVLNLAQGANNIYIGGPSPGPNSPASYTAMLVTPAFEMTKGAEYTVSYKAWKTNSTNVFSVASYWGTSFDAVNTPLSDGAVEMTYSSQEDATVYTYNFTAPDDGIFFIGLEGKAGAMGSLYLTDLSITEEGGLPDLDGIGLRNPYTNTFNSTESLNGYVNEGWEIYMNSSVRIYGNRAPASGTLVTPAFIVEEGKTYSINYNAFCSNAQVEVTLKSGDSPTALTNTIATNTIEATNADNPYTAKNEYTATETGLVYFAFESSVPSYIGINIIDLTIQEKVTPTGISLPYTNTFNSTESLDGYTLNGWSYRSANNAVGIGGGAAATSTLITPAFTVEEGKTYTVSYQVFNQGPGTITLMSGESADALNNTVGGPDNVTGSSSNLQTITHDYTADKDGIVYFGFDGSTPQYYSIYIVNLTIQEKEEIETTPLPYFNALNTPDCLDGYTNNGWTYTVNNTVVINGPGAGYQEGTLITPAFAVEEGVEYEISIDASGNPNSTLKITASDNLEGLTLSTLASSNDQENGEAFPLTNNTQNYNVRFTGTANGVMYIAFDGNCFARSSIQISNLNIEEYVPKLSIPYENALNYEGCLDGYTNNGWQYTVNNTVVINGPGAGYQEGTLITPAFEVEEDVEYEISIDASGNPNSTLTITASDNLEGLTLSTLASSNDQENGEAFPLTNNTQNYNVRFTGTSSGLMYIAFDGNCFARSSIQISNLSVKEYVPPMSLSFEDVEMEVTAGSTEAVTAPINVSIINAVEDFTYQGFQFDVTLPTGVKIAAVSTGLAGSIASNLTDEATNTYTVLAYLEGANTTLEDIATLTLSTTYNSAIKYPVENAPITISNVIFSSTKGEDIMTVEGFEGSVTITKKQIPATEISIYYLELLMPSFTSETGKVTEITAGEGISMKVELDPENTTDTVEDIVWTVSPENENFKFDMDAEGILTVTTEGVEVTTETTFTITGTITHEGSTPVTGTYDLTVKPVLLGDSNDSGVVTVADVVTTANVANAIQAEEPYNVTRFDFPNANVNLTEIGGVQVINAQDVTATVSIVMGTFNYEDGRNNVKRHTSVTNTNDRLVADNFTVTPGKEMKVGVRLDNSYDYAALQATVIVPEGMTVTGISKGARAASHDIAYNIGNGKIGVMLYSLSNSAFVGSDDELFFIHMIAEDNCGNISFDNINAADAASNGYYLGYDGGMNETGTTGIIGIDADKDARYFDLNGIEVKNPEKGIFIRVQNGEAVKVVK